MTLATFGAIALALFFSPVLIALARLKIVAAVVAFIVVCIALATCFNPPIGLALWLFALVIGAFAGAPRTFIVKSGSRFS